MRGTITQITQLTPDIKSFHIQVPGKPSYKPGQFAIVSMDIDGKVLRRAYSLVSPPFWENIEFIIKRHQHGVFSTRMHLLNVGDSIELAMPYGSFTLDEPYPAHMTFIAHNVGLSAVLGILRELDHKGYQGERLLIYVNQAAVDIAYKEELERLASRGLKIIFVITHDPSWDGDAGVDEELFRKYCRMDSCFFVHGPPQVAAAIEKELSHLGVSPQNIKLDRW